MKTLVKVLVALAIIAGAGGAYWWFYVRPGTGASAAGPGGPPAGFAMPVEAVAVKPGNVPRQITAIGTLRSDESVILRPEVMGRVAQIPFKEGTRVNQGDVLVQLDDSTARAELAEAKATLVLARANAQRAENLYAKGAGSEQNRDQAISTLHASEARVRLLQARLDKMTLLAPMKGVVGLRKVSVGELLQVGQEIVNLENVDPIKVDFRVPEIWFPSVKVGQQIAVALDALPGRKFSGEIYAIDPQIDADGRAIVIRARLPNADDTLRPGLFARVVLTLSKEKSSVLVPEQALVPIGSDQFVFKIVDGKAAMTKVKTGDRRGGVVEVLEGLAAGDTIVTAGQLKIRDGMPVQPVPSPQSS
jgi:membrane fusion protein (multidrug efflux system)